MKCMLETWGPKGIKNEWKHLLINTRVQADLHDDGKSMRTFAQSVRFKSGRQAEIWRALSHTVIMSCALHELLLHGRHKYAHYHNKKKHSTFKYLSNTRLLDQKGEDDRMRKTSKRKREMKRSRAEIATTFLMTCGHNQFWRLTRKEGKGLKIQK